MKKDGNMKRMIGAILTVVMLAMAFSGTVIAAENVQSQYYSDVYSTDSWYDATNYLYEHDVLGGIIAPTDTQKGVFSPTSSLTRGQIVTILWRMLNEPNPDGSIVAFSDCSFGAYYYDAVRWASSSNVGIISGYEDNTFRPSRAITNQEMLTLLYKFACFCSYASNTASATNRFITAFNASSLTNKGTFSSYAKAAVGWAYQNGFVTDYSISGSDSCTRGSIAECIYQFYKQYQKKYGLAVVCTKNKMSYAAKCSPAMQTLFRHYGASDALSRIDITREQFESAMRSAFSQAKALDICYLYCASHGSASGLGLFSDTSAEMTPEYLRGQIDSYDGTFVVFVSGCHSGTYISENSIANEGSDSESADFFDADSFVNILTKEEYEAEGSGLKGSQRIKVLCSSRKEELSYATDRLATYYWCLGSGYDYPNNTFVSIASDSNLDGRVSLEELYEYSHDRVLEALSGGRVQNIVCCADSDNYIIFESGY